MSEHPCADVVRWMLSEGRRETRMRAFGDEMCRRIVAAGVPIARAFCGVMTLHPQVAATAYIWRRDGEGAERLSVNREFAASAELRESPPDFARRTSQKLRRRLETADQFDFPVLAEFRAAGGTDYLALPMACSAGPNNVVTFLTDRSGGFTEAEVAGLEAVAEALSLIVELQATRRVARTLLNTYVGRRTGERVLAGAIARGDGETLRAVIWYCDLRGFTALADRLPMAATIGLLNEYFEAAVAAVAAEGGEVLKFIGDALLAIFELAPDAPAEPACAAALAAAERLLKALAERRAEPELRCAVALHLGEVSYGNIGAPDRLDFTVIGPAVNHAVRLEQLAARLGLPLIASAAFAEASPAALRSLGRHALRGVAEPQEAFALQEG